MSNFVFIIAGGGTGGHLFPGIAVARELEKRFENAGILFVVGRRRMESEILSRHQYRSVSIHVEGLKGRTLMTLNLQSLPISNCITFVRIFPRKKT